MRTKKRIKKMFKEIGLGSIKKRKEFLKYEEKENYESGYREQIFIRLDISTHAEKGGENAKLE